MQKYTKDPLTPEMWKLFKIFGLSSIVLVLLLSFFNEKRADNTGDRDEFSISDASRMYFKNVRSAYYDTENRRDAKMNLYRWGKRIDDSTQNILNATLIINAIKDAAYLYLEPQGEFQKENPLQVKWESKNGEKGRRQFFQGDRYSHYDFVKEVYPLLEDHHETQFWAQVNGKWLPILGEEKERAAFLTTCRDFFRMVKK
jgi:hypothetical protein